MERRLAAILAADIAGFTALVGQNEERTLRALQGHMGALTPMISLHSGRVFKTTGDGFLAEFGSVVDAVSCADAMQKLMAKRNAQQPDGERLVYRMGVHAGDVVIDGDDMLGDGVNIAARLEGVASSGGVAISARVHDDIQGKLDLVFTDLGPQTLKNVARPMQVFALAKPDAPAPQTHVALPDKPSVAVLPFTNMSSQAEDDYFADGMTEDITTALAYVPWIFVIARNSSFTYKGLSVDVRKVGKELGVRYVLEGSVRRSGQRLRVTGQLIDAATGAHLWAEKYDGVVEDVFDLQDRISESVVAAIAPQIRSAEIQRGLRKPPENLDAYDLYLRGQNALHMGQMIEADDWLAKSLVLAPDYAKPMAMRAWMCTLSNLYGRFSPPDVRARGLELASKAMRLAPDDAETQAYAGYAIGFLEGDPLRGLDLVRQASDRCPSFAWAWSSMSVLSAFAGQPQQALDYADVALRLSPRDPFAFRIHMASALANILLENYEAVLRSAEQGIAQNPRAIVLFRYKTIALNELGRTKEAQILRDQTLDMMPSFSTHAFIHNIAFSAGVAETLWNRYQELLLRAGFPE